MSGLLPSTPDVTRDPNPAPRVIGLESDDASDLIAALSSETARGVLASLHEEPATPSTVAERVDTSLQNVQYHLEKLESARLIEVVDTCYSAKGREMSVYAPTNGPLVVFPGSDDDAVDLEQLLQRVVASVAVLGLVSVVIEAIVRGLLPGVTPGEPFMSDDAAMTVERTDVPGSAPDAHWLVEAIVTAPPGLLVFLGGCTVIAVGFGIWAWRRSAGGVVEPAA